MKELSIEEKAKAYDKALAVARDFYNSTKYAKSHAEVKATYEAIFPVLAESEDERVRNKLIEFFKGYYPDEEWWGNITQEDILACLEKQDEQKPAEWSEEDREYMQSLLDIINGTSSLTPSEVECHKDWLKSLKDRVQPQFTWKPSDRQMNVLEYYMHTLACNEHKEILFGLYQDLKKLKE